MEKLEAKDLMSLEQYARERPAFRRGLLRTRASVSARDQSQGRTPPGASRIALTSQYRGAGDAADRADFSSSPQGIADESGLQTRPDRDGSNWKVTL